MPRPERFTDATRRRRVCAQLKENPPDWWAAPPLEEEEDESHHALLIRTHLQIRAGHSLTSNLALLLRQAKWEWQEYLHRGDVNSDPPLPNLGGVRPTPREMRATITSD